MAVPAKRFFIAAPRKQRNNKHLGFDRPKGLVCAGGRAGCASGVRAPAAAGRVRATATQFPNDARDVETHASITEHRKQVKEDTAKAEAGEGQHLDVLGREP
jgi:hypothetical protein